MERPTVQDIFLRFYPKYLDKHTPSPQQSKVANCIINCKTGAYGANVSVCEDCGHLQIHYNSCRNRCCPMCQALPKEKWMDKRREDVLDAPYFHVVFTVSQELNSLIYSNQQLLYDAMYHCVSATIEKLTSELQAAKQEELPYVQIANEISASYPEIKHVYIGQGNHITIDSLSISPCLIMKVQSDTLMSESSLEQFKKWIKVRLQTDNIMIDYTIEE